MQRALPGFAIRRSAGGVLLEDACLYTATANGSASICRLSDNNLHMPAHKVVEYYELRWQIETGYAELKIEMQMKGGLRSKKPAGIAYEVAGHILLYLLIRRLIVEAAVEHGLDPLRISFRNALRELREMWATIATSSPHWAANVLLPRLLERIASHQVPVRPGRSYPRKKKRKSNAKKS